jgi:ATP-dependent exoDNAse (exonuclease V) alpha subunit
VDNRVNTLLELLKTNHIFLTGGAGTGKSYLTNQIVKEYILDKKSVVTLGSTGISAINIAGQTIHSFFIFGICSNFDELEVSDRYNRSRLKELYKILSKLDLLVIDEISMVSASMMDMILYRLRSGGFKGKLLVVGDFFQLPPILKQSQNSIFGDGVYAFESSAWEHFGFVNVELIEVKRTTDKEFMHILNAIRIGDVTNEVKEYLLALKDEKKELKEPSVLFGRNYEATKLNNQMLNKLPQKEVVLDSQKSKRDSKLSDKRVKSWINSLPVEESLVLKEGAKVLFTTNKWGAYHNGQRAIVEHIDEDSIVVSDLRSGKLIKVDRYEFELTQTVVKNDEVKSEVLYSLKQFPLRLCYAITIHKSQGMSIDELICNVEHIFATSQFYVALSRATNPKTLKIEFNRPYFDRYLEQAIRVSESVKNFYKNEKFLEVK